MYVCAHSPPTHCSKRKKYTYDSLGLGDKVYPSQLTSMTPGIHLSRRHQPCSVLALHFSSFSGPGLIHLHPTCYGNPSFYPCNTQHLPQLPFEPPLWLNVCPCFKKGRANSQDVASILLSSLWVINTIYSSWMNEQQETWTHAQMPNITDTKKSQPVSPEWCHREEHMSRQL